MFDLSKFGWGFPPFCHEASPKFSYKNLFVFKIQKNPKIFKTFLFRRAIQLNPAVFPEISSLKDVWTTDFWGSDLTDEKSHHSWRPLTTLTFRYQPKKLQSLHLFNIIIHILNVTLFHQERSRNNFNETKQVILIPRCRNRFCSQQVLKCHQGQPKVLSFNVYFFVWS